MTKTARALVYAAFVYTCVEGLVINLLFPSKLPYVYKDLVILLVYLSVLAADPERLFNPSPTAAGLNWALALFAFVTGLYLLVPTRVTLLSELVAFKQRLFYLPLIYVAYLFLATSQDLRRLVLVLAVSAIPVSLFGIYLFFAGPEALQRLGATYSAVIYTPGGQTGSSYWRVPGTFTSPGQYGGYLTFNLVLVAGLLASPGVSRWTRGVLALALSLIVLAILTSGSRAALVVGCASVAVAVMMSGRLTRAAVWALAIFVILSYGFVALGPGVQERFGSIASYEHVERFRRTYFGQLFLPMLLQNPAGLGLGTATIGARHFSEFREVILVESYLGILAVEMGWLGLLAFLVVVWQVLRLVVRVRPLMIQSPEAMLWLAAAAYVIQGCAVLPVSTFLDAAPSNFYFWFTVGTIVRMVDLEHWRLWLAARAEPAPAEVESPAALVQSR